MRMTYPATEDYRLPTNIFRIQGLCANVSSKPIEANRLICTMCTQCNNN